MDRNTTLICIAAILETLSEVDGAPETMIWLGLQSQFETLDNYYHVAGIMRDARLIKVSHNYVTITEKGRSTVAKLKATRQPAEVTNERT